MSILHESSSVHRHDEGLDSIDMMLTLFARDQAGLPLANDLKHNEITCLASE